MNRQVIVGVVIAAVAFILVGIAMAFGPTMLEGFEDTRNATNDWSESDNGSTPATGCNVSRAVTLTYTPWGGNVTSITSTHAGDTPNCYSLTGTSMNVTGLTSNTTRTLTTVYNYSTPGYYTGLSDTVQFGPTMILLGFIITVGIGGFLGIAVAGHGIYKSYRD